MTNKEKRIIPKVPKEERETVEIGMLPVPAWMLYALGILVFLYLAAELLIH